MIKSLIHLFIILLLAKVSICSYIIQTQFNSNIRGGLCLYNNNLMKYLFRLAIVTLITFLIVPTHNSFTNTTNFFNSEVNTTLPYQMFSGYEDIDWYYPKGSASMYYSLWTGFNMPIEDKTIPLIIWLQGGPGAASQFGCFNQVGPLYIQGKKGSFRATENPWGWSFFGHLLCLDQPVGVGFSYNNNTKKVDNTRDAANHFVNFLVNFFANNPKLNLKNNPIYLAGQSYAGHYIPAFAQKLKTNSSIGVNLQGVLIGDGYVDPINQVNNYDSFLNAAGIVSNQWRDTTSFMQNEAITRIMRGDLKQSSGYINFIIADDNVANKYYAGMNVLNYKQYDAGNINPDYGLYLQEKKKNFGVPDWLNYDDDNEKMYDDFAADLSTSFKRQLERILSLGVNTLIYNGQNDFIVNTPGVLAYLNTLEWPLAKQWRASTKKTWREYGTKNLGWFKKYGNLNFVLVRNAGHLLPSDQPRSAWAMLNNYFYNNW